MRDKVFIDTNLLVYANLNNVVEKQNEAIAFFQNIKGNDIIITTQVLGELFNVLVKKKVSSEEAMEILEACIAQMNIFPVSLAVVQKCLEIKRRYGYSYWDSQIIAAALVYGCSIVYSEDMSNGQVIEGTLTIINPFKP